MSNEDISKEAVLEFAEEYGYNMDIFKVYLAYQESNKAEFRGKFTFEESILMKINDGFIDKKNVCMGSIRLQEQYALWMGFDAATYIPDYLCFEHYCISRDLWEMDPNRYDDKGKLKAKKPRNPINTKSK